MRRRLTHELLECRLEFVPSVRDRVRVANLPDRLIQVVNAFPITNARIEQRQAGQPATQGTCPDGS